METQVKNLFQKIELDFSTLKDSFSSEVNNIEQHIKQSNAAVNSYLEEYTAQTVKKDDVTAKLIELKNQIGILDKQNTELKERIAALEKNKSELQKQTSEYETKQAELETEKSKLENNLSTLTGELTTLTDDISSATKDLLATEEEYKKQVGATEEKIKNLEAQRENEENQYKVLIQLFKEGYIKDPTYDVLKGLGQSGIDDHKKLALSANTQEGEVVNILKDLATHKIVSYDASSGKFTLLKELEL